MIINDTLMSTEYPNFKWCIILISYRVLHQYFIMIRPLLTKSLFLHRQYKVYQGKNVQFVIYFAFKYCHSLSSFTS